MKSSKKKGRRLILLLIVCAVMLAAILFFLTHRTYWRYNDRWVVGNTVGEVQERYGVFDYGEYAAGSSGTVGYYIYTDNGVIMPDHLAHYYMIEYDDDGIVTGVQDAVLPGG